MHPWSRWIHKTAYGRISTESSWGSYCRKGRQIHHSITIWYTNWFSCLKQWRYPQQKQQWIKNERNLEKISAWILTKVRSKKEVIDEQVHFASLMDICPFEECRIGGEAPKIQRSSCTPTRRCERWFWILLQYSLNKDLQHLKWQPPRSWISSPDCQVAMDKQQTQYQLIPK